MPRSTSEDARASEMARARMLAPARAGTALFRVAYIFFEILALMDSATKAFRDTFASRAKRAAF